MRGRLVSSSLGTVLSSRLWQAGTLCRDKRGDSQANIGVGTGFDCLDDWLPWSGWPLGALTEILVDGAGVGELELILPALASLTQGDRWVAWVAPPYIPYAPALAARGLKLNRVLCVGCSERRCSPLDYLWAAEQLLRFTACSATLIWLESYPQQERILRRLQAAAEAGGSWGVVFRAATVATRSSPVALRLELQARTELEQGARVKILKCRGRAPSNMVLDL